MIIYIRKVDAFRTTQAMWAVSSSYGPTEVVTCAGFFGSSFVRNRAWEGALVMPKKRFSAEPIVMLLRQIEVLLSQGKVAPVACRDGIGSRAIIAGGRNTVGWSLISPRKIPAPNRSHYEPRSPAGCCRGDRWRTTSEWPLRPYDRNSMTDGTSAMIDPVAARDRLIAR